MANIAEDFDNVVLSDLAKSADKVKELELICAQVADDLDQLANNANFWSRDRIATKARQLRNELRKTKRYGLCIICDQAISAQNTVLVKKGDKRWVTRDKENTSSPTQNNLIIFATVEEAKRYYYGWKPHPWYCIPIGYEIVEV